MFVFRNYTIENLFPEGTTFSGYDDISVIPDNETELVWFYQVPIGFDAASKTAAIENIGNQLRLVISRLSVGQSLTICRLIDMFPVKFNDSDTGVEDAIDWFNKQARELEIENPNVRFLDIMDYFAQYPKNEWINWRFYFISQMIVAPTIAANFASWFSHRIEQLKGLRKKCLVLDLDNTLWGGILGEDGINGIKIGGDYPGNAFLYFQESLIDLSKSGVILTVCSKNNEQDVLDVWAKNPFIKLNNQHISAYRINWNNKADNIAELAAELNIGLDSMVFIDDNPAERELVRQRLPMVTVPEFPKKPYGLMELFHELVEKYFRAHRLTSEDLQKTAQYKANAMRASAAQKYSDITDFIKSLEITIKIRPADKFNIPRIAQMTQKTNQFNLTTKRYTEADVEAFVERGDYVFCISVEDKFGDSGITGAIIITRDADNANIDSFLLSCRILGKGIEDVFFKYILNQLIDKGVKAVKATYIPTKKNQQVATFYDRQGLNLIDETDGTRSYSINIDKKFQIPEYYNVE